MKDPVFKDLLTIEKDIKNILVDTLDLYEQQRFFVNYKELIDKTIEKIYSLHNGIKSFIEDSNSITLVPSNSFYNWTINNTFTLKKSKDCKRIEESLLSLFVEDSFAFFKVDQEYIHNIHYGQRDNFRLSFDLIGDTNKVTFIPNQYREPPHFSQAGDYFAFKRFWPLIDSYIEYSFQAIHNKYDSILSQNTKKITDIAPILALAEENEELRAFFPESKPYSLNEAIQKLKKPEVLDIMEVILIRSDVDAIKILEDYVEQNNSPKSLHNQTQYNKTRQYNKK